MKRVFLQEEGGGRLIDEMKLLRDAFGRRGHEIVLFTSKNLARRKVPIDAAAIVAGTVPVMLSVMKLLAIPEPDPNDYPAALEPFFRRRIWRSTLGAVESALASGGEPVFVKPAERRKRFTGFVAHHVGELSHAEGASRAAQVWCSTRVSWKSEWRYYVLHGAIIGADPYAGDQSLEPSRATVQEAVATLTSARQAPAAFAIDFGVLTDGSAALVELNDGFSIGTYGLGAEPYADFTLARWEELLGTRA